MVKIGPGDMVQLKSKWVEQVGHGYPHVPDPKKPRQVLAFTMEFGTPGAIDVGTPEQQCWCWVNHFDLIGGPW